MDGCFCVYKQWAIRLLITGAVLVQYTLYVAKRLSNLECHTVAVLVAAVAASSLLFFCYSFFPLHPNVSHAFVVSHWIMRFGRTNKQTSAHTHACSKCTEFQNRVNEFVHVYWSWRCWWLFICVAAEIYRFQWKTKFNSFFVVAVVVVEATRLKLFSHLMETLVSAFGLGMR